MAASDLGLSPPPRMEHPATDYIADQLANITEPMTLAATLQIASEAANGLLTSPEVLESDEFQRYYDAFQLAPEVERQRQKRRLLGVMAFTSDRLAELRGKGITSGPERDLLLADLRHERDSIEQSLDMLSWQERANTPEQLKYRAAQQVLDDRIRARFMQRTGLDLSPSYGHVQPTFTILHSHEYDAAYKLMLDHVNVQRSRQLAAVGFRSFEVRGYPAANDEAVYLQAHSSVERIWQKYSLPFVQALALQRMELERQVVAEVRDGHATSAEQA